VSKVSFVEIIDDQVGQRIDNFLFTHLKGVPKSHIYQLLRKGEIRVNKKRIKPVYRLQLDDIIRIAPIRMAPPEEQQEPGNNLKKLIHDHIIYEDLNLLIVNKPAGLAVHGGSGINLGLIEALRAMRPQERFLELVHRLDRDTSGCLIVAKKRSILRELHELLRKGKVTKIYQALTLGHWPKKINKIKKAIRKNTLQSGERIVKVAEDGKAAYTEIHVIKKHELADLVEVILHTGKTHQIRVHTQDAGHPVAGDQKYGDRAFNKIMKAHGLNRMFLHAHKIEFTLPSTEKLISITAPLDTELDRVASSLVEHE
jgi:23S rRNA pseudouridine955/2504/2580 synthase